MRSNRTFCVSWRFCYQLLKEPWRLALTAAPQSRGRQPSEATRPPLGDKLHIDWNMPHRVVLPVVLLENRHVPRLVGSVDGAAFEVVVVPRQEHSPRISRAPVALNAERLFVGGVEMAKAGQGS